MSRLSTWLVVLFCTVVLVVRSADVHVHLCFDGQEPAVSIHFEDGAALSGHLTEVVLAHNDLDIDVASDAAAKAPKLNAALHALFVSALFLVLALLAKPLPAFSGAAGFRFSTRSYFLPPLRGPPRLFVR